MAAKGGAPLKNMNSVRNGSRICRLILGNWPGALNRVQRYSRQYRITLEEEVLNVRDSVDAMAAHWIDAACQHEATRQVCRWILRERWDELTAVDIERNAKSMADATDKRNAAVAKLGLDTPHSGDPWSLLEAQSRPSEQNGKHAIGRSTESAADEKEGSPGHDDGECDTGDSRASGEVHHD